MKSEDRVTCKLHIYRIIRFNPDIENSWYGLLREINLVHVVHVISNTYITMEEQNKKTNRCGI